MRISGIIQGRVLVRILEGNREEIYIGKKIIEETKEGIPEGVPERILGGIPGEIPRGILERIHEEIPGEIHRKIPGEIHAGILGIICEKGGFHAGMVRKILEGIPGDSPK